ncbi:MAG: hypothetical protein QOJ35_14 [Solirubrobacteraceae bacterium]|nr:hypothetical protein [Solirubrobacteraceae bacterium]
MGQAAVTSATRDVAQAGALAGAIFGALVGADPFDVRNRTAWVKDVDYIAIALWVGAVLLFLFVAAAAARLWMPLVVAGAAGLLTMAALVAVPFAFSEDHDNVALRLAPQEQRAISALCHVTTTPLRGRIKTQTLEATFVVVERIPQERGATCDTIRIPATAILALQEHPATGK